jgi:hypothetical protein
MNEYHSTVVLKSINVHVLLTLLKVFEGIFQDEVERGHLVCD